MVERDAADAAQPSFEIADPDIKVLLEPGLGDHAFRDHKKIRCGDVDVLAFAGDLVRLRHLAIATSPGCATQVPSCPSPASRSLSARTFSIAASLAPGSSRIGICAAMPPIAWIPRRWQVLISSRL